MKINRRLLCLLPLLLLFPIFKSAYAQVTLDDGTELTFREADDSLKILALTMLRDYNPATRMDAGMSFGKFLYKVLKDPKSYKFKFDSLATAIHILPSEDGKLRIFNWLLVPQEQMIRYYGIVQTAERTYPLTNYSDRLWENKNLSQTTLDQKHWLGAEYYKIMSKEVNGQPYYFLFGLNRDGDYTSKKLLDVISFDSVDEDIAFGAPLFVFPSESGRLATQSRIIWQFDPTSTFYLDFDQDKKMIVFDELRSSIHNPLRKNTYVPTGQMDGLKWVQDHWQFEKQIVQPLQLKDGQAPLNGVIQKAPKE